MEQSIARVCSNTKRVEQAYRLAATRSTYRFMAHTVP